MPWPHGFLTISLDFELHWGVRDKKTVAQYRDNLIGVREAIPLLLDTFQEYHVHATWATVGFLFFKEYDELMAGLPTVRPRYLNPRLDPYREIATIGKNEKEDPYHYAATLIGLIASYPDQDIGSHTFSHYYCLEPGQNGDIFRADLVAAVRAAGKSIPFRSLVFPRNQCNKNYLDICRDLGFTSYRGTEKSAWYAPQKDGDAHLWARGLRLVDRYWRVSGHNCSVPDELGQRPLFDIPSSRFLGAYSPSTKTFESLRLRRILGDLTFAYRQYYCSKAKIQPSAEDNFSTYPLLQLATGIPLLKESIRDALLGQLHIAPSPPGRSRLWSHPTLWGYLWARLRWRVK